MDNPEAVRDIKNEMQKVYNCRNKLVSISWRIKKFLSQKRTKLTVARPTRDGNFVKLKIGWKHTKGECSILPHLADNVTA